MAVPCTPDRAGSSSRIHTKQQQLCHHAALLLLLLLLLLFIGFAPPKAAFIAQGDSSVQVSTGAQSNAAA
jgi:hypothetical protein